MNKHVGYLCHRISCQTSDLCSMSLLRMSWSFRTAVKREKHCNY